MKNISYAINGVLAIAVIILYYLHFSGPAQTTRGEAGPSGNTKIAYINSDSVLKYYDYFKVSREKLESKGKQMDQEFKSRAVGLQGEFESYQRNRGSMTIGQAGAVEEDLGKKRQNLQMYQESLSQQLLADQERMTKDLYDKVTSYLRKYGQENGLEIVFKYDATSDLLYVGDSLDISSVVIKGLNDTYLLEKSTQAKKDSVAKKK
ncbi:MAG: OmpH family outer membrane protein [Cytophagales bacterium]|nr:OmpH family outer membrane protein [Cytophagales bacterium]